ncbi:hypothetical protein GQ54DRAFT_303603 [Martensiomyces pterosporus]|nr:hypothetical protein GQ54DRAFT_303603 [Martensiomyces pterosporus]
MRCLRTVDFLSDIDPVLRNLQFILRIILKALCLILDNDRLRKVLADRPISSDITDLITDKFSALEDGEVRSHAFKQTLADPLRLHQQLLHYILLAISKLDIRSSQSAYMLYQDLVAMLLDLFSSQVHAEHIDSSTNVFINELLDNVGPSTVFNVDRTPAQEVVETLLLNVSEAPAFPSGQGLVLSAYSYFFSRQPLAVQARHLEQQSLMLLLLLASQPSPVDGRPRNPFLAALEGVADAPEPAIKIENRVSFRRLFAKIVAEIQSIEWTVLFQVLVARNNAFRTYVLARTDPDTVIIPLLKRISAATALPVPSASNSHHSHGPHKRDSLPSSGFGASISANGGGSGSGKQGEKFTGSIFSSPKLAAASSPTYASFISEPLQKDSVLQQPQQLQQQQPWSPMSQSMLSPINTKGLPATTLTTTTTTTTTTTATPRTGTVSSATPTSATTAQAGTTPTAPSPSIKLRQGAAPQSILTVDTVPYVQLYCWMDILLCLSSDAQFVEQLQRTTIEFWASTPHPMHRQPLSLCMVAEAMRIFQLNIMLLKDAHIHGLSLGILSNILNESTNITTAISQKLVKLFEMIHRRYSKLTSMPELALVEVEERHVYEETLTALLALFCKLVNSNNPQFIYCLLQAREILGSFRKPTSDSGSADGIADKAAGYSAELRRRL